MINKAEGSMGRWETYQANRTEGTFIPNATGREKSRSRELLDLQYFHLAFHPPLLS